MFIQVLVFLMFNQDLTSFNLKVNIGLTTF
jgi:hypothetical protein